MKNTNSTTHTIPGSEKVFCEIISDLLKRETPPSDLYLCLDRQGNHSLTERSNGECRAVKLTQSNLIQLRNWICEQLPWAVSGDSAGFLKGFRVRVNRRPYQSGEELVLRILPHEIPSPEQLTIPDTIQQWFYSLKGGLVLFVGPTGSGKSSSIASLLQEVLAERPCRVMTLEDPIEYLFTDRGDRRGFCIQRELGAHFNTFASGLRESLRQNPDIIMVQEIRDTETAEVALSAALSGHQVVASIHGSTVAEGIRRFGNLLGVDGDWDAFILTLAGVVSQRLLRADGPRKPAFGGSRVAGFSLLINNPGVAAVLRRKQWHQLEQLLEVGEADGFLSYHRNYLDLISKGFIQTELRGIQV